MATDKMPVKREYLWLVVAVLVVGLVVTYWENQPVPFGRRVFEGLVNGQQAIHRAIDWEHLKAFDTDVGATYAKLPNEREKADYRRAFIERCAAGFRQGGGSVRAFTNWRVEERTGEQVVVAADYSAKQSTLLLSLTTQWPAQLRGLEWQR